MGIRVGRIGLAGRFVGLLMQDGGRAKAERILRRALDEARRRMRGAADNETILTVAVARSVPQMTMVRVRVAGIWYEVPKVVPERSRVPMAVRTILAAAARGDGRTMARRLARALIAAYRGEIEDCFEPRREVDPHS